LNSEKRNESRARKNVKLKRKKKFNLIIFCHCFAACLLEEEEESLKSQCDVIVEEKTQKNDFLVLKVCLCQNTTTKPRKTYTSKGNVSR
jgi:hypothetical protein